MKNILLKLPLPGMRNFKTSLAVFLCLALYHALGQDGALLAAIAALICMQDSVEKSIRDGINRVLGTIVGGILGVIFISLDIIHINPYVAFAACMAGVSLLIYLGVLIHKKDSIAISCIVFLIIAIDTSLGAPIVYSVKRVIDTIAGITIAVIVNRFLRSPGQDRVRRNGRSGAPPDIPYVLRRAGSQSVSKWNGGTTTEVYIFPQHALYGERDFLWRLSRATVEHEETDFTPLGGYSRHVMVLEGRERLVHKGRHSVILEPFDADFFDGGWETKCFGTATDFNVMLKTGYDAEVVTVRGGDSAVLDAAALTGFYCLEDGVEVSVSCAEGRSVSESLDKGDFICFDELSGYGAEFTAAFAAGEAGDSAPVAIKVVIRQTGS